MRRTQVYFPENTLKALKAEAKEKDTSLAAVIREKVEKNLPKRSPEEIKRALKATEELAQISMPTMSPAKMKKIFSEAHGRTYDLLSRR